MEIISASVEMALDNLIQSKLEDCIRQKFSPALVNRLWWELRIPLFDDISGSIAEMIDDEIYYRQKRTK